MLQIESLPDIWKQLATQGPLAILLGFCVYILWKRMNKLSDKLNAYMERDREKMMNCINDNTQAMQENTRLLNVIMKKIQNLNP